MTDTNTGNRNTGHRNTGNWNTGNWNTGDWNTGDWNTGNWNTGDWNTGNQNTGNRNTGDWNTGNWNTGDWNTGHRNTGHRNTGNWNTGHRNTGDWNTGDLNTGDWNTGDLNTGFFNTNTPENVRAFNKDLPRKDWDDARKPDWLYKPSPTTWVSDSDMTDQEKVDHPTFHTCGGYLRANDWADEWQKAYASASLEDIQAVRDLPNFDAAIFKEITGIDLTQEKQSAPREIIIEGARYILAEGER